MAAVAIAEPSPQSLVRCACLELIAPSLQKTPGTLRGVDAARGFPLFLRMGKHAREDLPPGSNAMADMDLCRPSWRKERRQTYKKA